MTEPLVIVTEPEDGVVEAVLNRPDKLNAITPELMRAIADAQAKIAGMSGVRCVVLRGEGRAFCAGLDKSGFERMKNTGAGSLGMDIMERTHGPANVAQNACWGWRMLDVPVVCALQGFALGGGFQICLGADIRIAAPGTRFSIMEMKWGLVPDMGGMAAMRHIARGDVIRKLTYTAEVFEAEAALVYGFVTELAEDPLARARELAREIAGKSPSALRSAKALLNIADEEAGALEPLLAESRLQKDLIGKPDQLEAIAAGMEGRPARYA
ncbi:crotonase/enoyl-CoA hydratase family protein [Albimonas sp. CAU 1670]|uniref:crotonase/enoyl-CoA hydratase family protein n=1 Tax=Albimonas sp. CAU 1670 TaxID=3032599 RepID=UPI0023DB5E60|nr:crotonase/enoyl-CoA hydratase family protein [Albimonas sp. CAU 1670]MDF2232858.1 crotonase/enoyl-CoA hydratase family protein [Albimonas sp. CAU 1670]